MIFFVHFLFYNRWGVGEGAVVDWDGSMADVVHNDDQCHYSKAVVHNNVKCHPSTKHISLVIFLKPIIKFVFFILKILFTSKTLFCNTLVLINMEFSINSSYIFTISVEDLKS